jgi:hypothetical protein
MTFDRSAIDTQARLHHAYFLGLLLMVSSRKGPQILGDWMFRLFRRQHHDKFLSSFNKLGLTGLPDAVACAKYHALSNGIGGVPVEYMYESDRKAWVRFRYPRWWLDGPTLCGVPVEASHGFMSGWYAHNGVSLGNPRLGFVCVSEDMTGEFGFCGYFQEYDHDLAEEQRLRYAKGEYPPPFRPDDQPSPPAGLWSEERLVRASRNYAVEFVRNAIAELLPLLGAKETSELGGLTGRLIGLQYYAETARNLGVADGDAATAGELLTRAFNGMGDECVNRGANDGVSVSIEQSSLRIVRGMSGEERETLLTCWIEIWRGMLRAFRTMKSLETAPQGDGLVWHIRDRS